MISKNVKFKKVKTEKDIETVVAIANIVWKEHYIPIIGEKQVQYMLKNFQSKEAIVEQINSEYIYYKIICIRKSIGYLSIKPLKDERKLFLSKLYLFLEHRGKGLSKVVIEFLKTLTKDLDLDEIYLTVNKNNTNSITAYKKLGFSITEEIVQDIGSGFVMDDYVMRLPILE
ncbi:GNAT family N-acetyltransferase [bacterium]|nr:GNAT family N-acetyltransferase [bacterium]